MMMSELIEGVGEEVLWVLLALVLIVIISLAWISTGIPPVEYYVWLVQMQVYPNRRIVQVLHMDHEDAGVLENQLVQRGNVEEQPEDSVRIPHDAAAVTEGETSNTNVVVETPPAVANTSGSDARWSSQNGSSVARHWEVELTPPADSGQPTTINTSPSPDRLQQTLRRRTLVDDVGRASRQARRLLLSRLPVALQQPEGAASAVVPDLNTIAPRTRTAVERRDDERVADVDTEQHVDSVGTAQPNSASNLVKKRSASTEALLEGKQSTEIGSVNEEHVSGAAGNGTSQDLSNIKLKFLDDTQIIASTALDATVGQFKRRYFWESIVAGKVVRLIYRGQLLRDDSRSLSSYGLHDQCVLHCHVSSTPYTRTTASPQVSTGDTDANSGLGGTLLQSATAAAIAAIAGAQSVSASTAPQFARRVPQTYHGRSIEDSPNDPILLRVRNALLRSFRSIHNSLLGPDPDLANGTEVNAVEAAAEAAARGWNRQEQSLIGGRLGQYLHLLFIVKFVMLWAFVFFYPQYTDRFSLLLLTFLSLFFATIMFSNRRAETPLPVNS
uniref:Ubiquitin-like domain-containing protein n=1 Tax=Parascaris univalens TaxID=6257 RepID=A0A915AKW2_PARUN